MRLTRETPEHMAWRHMMERCYRETDAVFRYYGGRGISVCPRWRDDFAAFLADMGPRPSPLHSLDRIDNNGGYSPDNCRWATKREQSLNSRHVRPLTAFGRTQAVSLWAEETGIVSETIFARLRRGWPAESAVSFPPKLGGRTRGIRV